MLDVVFILLIFFLVTASFVRESGVEISRPDTLPRSVTAAETILVTIGDSDQVWIEGLYADPRRLRAHVSRFLAERACTSGNRPYLHSLRGRHGFDGWSKVAAACHADPRRLRAHVSRFLAERPEATVAIRASEHSRTETLVRVIDQARLAGATSVSMLTP